MKSAHTPSTPDETLQAISRQCFKASAMQFGTSLKLFDAMSAGLERLREVQLEAVREFQAQQQEVEQALHKRGDGQQLFAAQMGLMNGYMNGCIKYWTRLAEAAQQTQVELLGIVQSGQHEAGKPAAK